MTNEEILEIIDNDEDWDTGKLGRDEAFARKVVLTPEQEANIDKVAACFKTPITFSCEDALIKLCKSS